MSLTHDQKARLAYELILAAANLVEIWDEHQASGYGFSRDITAEQAAAQFAAWLIRLPGTAWDDRLPLPSKN